MNGINKDHAHYALLIEILEIISRK